MDVDVREATTVLLGLAGGVVLALLLLFVMVGGGFIAAVLVLGLLPLAFATVATIHAAEVWTPRSAASPSIVPRLVRGSLAQTALAALVIAGAVAAVMALVRGPAHALADLRTHAVFVVLTALGGSALLAMIRAAALQPVERYVAAASGLGVFIAAMALLSCCLWTLAYSVPLLSLVVLALVLNETLIALAGLVVNAVGLVALAVLRREAYLQA